MSAVMLCIYAYLLLVTPNLVVYLVVYIMIHIMPGMLPVTPTLLYNSMALLNKLSLE